MKNKGNVLISLRIMLAGLIHSPTQVQHKHRTQDVVYQLDV